MHSVLRIGLVLIGGAILAACGGAPLATRMAAAANISLTTNPNPPKSGSVEVVVNVTDVKGQPIPDADVIVFGNQTEMSGMSVNGKATAQRSGRYAIKADFGMTGKWNVTVQVKKPPLNVSKDFTLEFK